MFRRPVAVVLVAGMVVLAGCGGVLGGDGDSASPTNTPAELPPGVSQSGITNATQLSETHANTLVSTGFEATYTLELEISAATGSRTQRIDQRVEAGRELTPFYVNATTTQGDRTAVTQYWGNESVAVQRQSGAGQTQYSSIPNQLDREQQFTFGTTLGQLLRFGDYSLEETDTKNGETLLTFRADSVNTSLGAGNSSFVDAENVSGLSSELVVEADGIVHSFDLDFNASTAAGEANYDVSFDLLDVGDRSPTEPPWLQEALANITTANLSATLENDVIRLDHDGGDAVPNESVVFVQSNGSIYQTTLTEPIEPDTRLYFALNRSAGTVSLVDSREAGTTVNGEVTVIVMTANRQTLLTVTLRPTETSD